MYTLAVTAGEDPGRSGSWIAWRQLGGRAVKHRITWLFLTALLAGLVGSGSAASPFERGHRARLGPSLPHDSPPPATMSGLSVPPASAPSTSTATNATVPNATNAAAANATTTASPAPAPTAAQQATAVARSVMDKVDPATKSLMNRQVIDPKNPSTATANPAPNSALAPPSAAMNRQEKKLGAGVDSARADDSSRQVNQLQRGMLNDQKSSVGITQ